MKVHTLFIMSCALCVVACSKQEPVEPEQPEAGSSAAPAEEMAKEPLFDQAFIDHMHAHAEQLDELMFALADDDLDGAMTPAFWLSRHDSVTGVPEEWQQYITGMREAASAVEAAADLDAAKAAAEVISTQCQACHATAGVNTQDSGG
jgi:cytochrome c556